MENNDVKKHYELKGTERLNVGINFLHTHPKTERELGLDANHVIVDKTDYERVLKFLNSNHDIVTRIERWEF